MPEPIVETCVECGVALACNGSEGLKKVCNHGFGAPANLILCTLNPGGCAVSGKALYVPLSKYPHYCKPKGA